MSADQSNPAETFEYNEADQADIEKLFGEPDGGPDIPSPEFHTILEVWREVLKPANDEAKKKVTPQWANRMITSYAKLDFADLDILRDMYFEKIAELAQIVDAEIATDSDALTWATPEEDGDENSEHYKNVLTEWQLRFLGWELDWTCTDEWASVELASISEVHKMFFGDNGLTQFLDNIRFEFTEADQAELAGALKALRDAKVGSSE